MVTVLFLLVQKSESSRDGRVICNSRSELSELNVRKNGGRMAEFFAIGPHGTVHIYGVKLVGVNAENAGKLLLTLVFIGLVLLLTRILRTAVRWFLKGRENVRAEFWTRQGVSLAMAVLMVVGILSIWFDDPARLATGLGLLTAGLAFALQKVVTSIAGCFLILRGRTFNVGDRITMGGVRGDVIALNFTQTTIMEMGRRRSAGAEKCRSGGQARVCGLGLESPRRGAPQPLLWRET